MPTYEYACRDCDQHVEVVQSFRDDPLTECPTCSGRLRKVYGATGIIFKGSGYYVTDSRKAAADAAKARSDKDKGASEGAKTGEGATAGSNGESAASKSGSESASGSREKSVKSA
jgi:putative FmdB family regulatory protein